MAFGSHQTRPGSHGPVSPVRNDSGNVFAMLFAAVALTGVLASVGMQTLTGPVTTITRVTQKNIADNNLLMNGKIIVNAAVTGAAGGDPDSDGIIEPAPFVAPGGGGTLSSLSDVSVSSPASGQVLQYNGTAWANVSASSAMTTTTMASGWPDGIRCAGSAGTVNLVLSWGNAAATTATYTLMGDYGASLSSNSPTLTFSSTTAAGVLTETASWTNFLTNCSGLTIAQLYAAGQAFNFIGTGAVTTFNVGTVSAPGLAVTSDTDTGLYQSAANTVDIAAGGVRAASFATASSGVNYLAFTPAATGAAPTITTAGSDTNIGLTVTPKGTGTVTVSTARRRRMR